jgi:hypothetical protein
LEHVFQYATDALDHRARHFGDRSIRKRVRMLELAARAQVRAAPEHRLHLIRTAKAASNKQLSVKWLG